MKAARRLRDPDETVDLRTLILNVVPDAEHWMDTPNPHFDLAKPKDLIGTEKEKHLRNLVRAVKNGMFS
ncbi:MAG TPA: antitoxin Xre/MbcA/ParS toxin-binding domain-containing protein [Isosphaeraceae bacterium]|nr:antitoxin Xre/MbcA/ParS toxin-binding domain-containing protein [Isosphaeraceae bacterium]